MAKGSKRQRKSTRPPNKSRSRDDPSHEKDMDEIDAFHKQRDVIPLDVNGGAADDSDDDTEMPVFDFEDINDDDDSDASGSGEDEDEDFANDKQIAKMTKQVKYLRQKNVGGDNESSDDAEDSEEEKTVWGSRKGSYYEADNVDFEVQSSDEDLPMEEEAEVLKMQREKAKTLSMEDFGLEDVGQDQTDPGGQGKTFQDILSGKKVAMKSSIDGLLDASPFEVFEEIKKDLNTLSKEEQMDVVDSYAPELVGLLSELDDALNQLEKVKPLLSKVKEIKDASKGAAVHYLEVKHMLLLAYCQAIGFYLLLKSEGHPVRDHPVIARLVEIKDLFEKMKQIDANIPSLMEEPVNDITIGDSGNEQANGSVQLELEPEMKKVKEAAELEHNKSKKHDSKDSSKKEQDVRIGLQSLEMLKIRANLEAKLKQKGVYNSANHKLEGNKNHPPTSVNRRLETLHDFDDEVQQAALPRGMSKGPTASLHANKLSQLVAPKVKRPKFVSGDDDLPERDDIGERRRKHELRVLARAGAESEDDDGEKHQGRHQNDSMDTDLQEDIDAEESEDEFYKEVKKQKIEKLKAKQELSARTPIVRHAVETEMDGKRQITTEMEKNRGLTRPRKKLIKIPRKKYKIKHKKAVVRRKGQVRDVRKQSGPYGGEMSGINPNVSHSTRLKS